MLTVVSDAAITAIIARIDFHAAVRAAYIEVATGIAASAPVLRAPGPAPEHGLNAKFGASSRLCGGKVGTYWPGNAAHGLPNHGATTLLLDPDTGYPEALLAARLLNRMRTAAGNAVAADVLARGDATILALVGGGAQAAFEARAICAIRPIREIRIGVRDPARAATIVGELAGLCARVTAMDIADAVRSADIVVTATSARIPVIDSSWIGAGTHVAAMGADAVGKQELDPALLPRAQVFADLVDQAIVIGECQHAAAQGLLAPTAITNIGDVLNRISAGRDDDDSITIFDSSGLAVQDLHVARAALAAVRAAGLAVDVAF